MGLPHASRWQQTLLLAAALCTLPAFSQAKLVEPPAPLLPTDATFTAPTDLPPDTAEQTAVLQEDGLKRAESRTLISPQSAPGRVSVYEFGDATGAFAAYTYFRLGGKPVPGGKGVFATEFRKPDGEVIFLSGTTVVRATRSTDALLQSIETGLPKIGGRRAVSPLLPTMFPVRAYDSASLRYALGPVAYQAMGGQLPAADLGWDKSAEVGIADYHKGKLTLLLYPTPQIAGERGRVIQDDINRIGPKSFGMIKMRRVGPLVGVTSGDLTDAQAIDLVSELKLNQEITFDKKMPVEFHAEVRKTYTLLQSIAVFSGITILASIVLGVFLGGARAGIRVLQGKPAASEPEFLRIDLRGQPDAPVVRPDHPEDDRA